MASRGQIAAEEYTDTSEIGARPGWTNSSIRPVVPVTSLVGDLNNQWINLGSSSSANVARVLQGWPDVGGGKRQVEYTFAWHWNSSNTPGNGQDLCFLGIAGASSISPRIWLETGINPDTGTNEAVYAVIASQTTGQTPVLTPFRISQNSLFYITVRMESETSGGSANDGKAEFWINGQRVHFAENLNWVTNASYADFTVGVNSTLRVQGVSGGDVNVRNIMVNDSFTTPFGTAPEYKHVASVDVSAVVAPTYTIEGGAASQEVAISDSDDATTIMTTSPADQASVGFTVPASLASEAVRDVQIRTRVSRGNVTNNNMDIELRDGAGTVVLGSDTFPVAAVTPNRETIETTIVPSSSITLDDFTVVVRNGV